MRNGSCRRAEGWAAFIIVCLLCSLVYYGVKKITVNYKARQVFVVKYVTAHVRLHNCCHLRIINSLNLCGVWYFLCNLQISFLMPWAYGACRIFSFTWKPRCSSPCRNTYRVHMECHSQSRHVHRLFFRGGVEALNEAYAVLWNSPMHLLLKTAGSEYSATRRCTLYPTNFKDLFKIK